MLLVVAHAAEAASVMRQCRKACTDEIDTCIADGGRRFACRKLVLGQCKRTGVVYCGGAPTGAIVAPTTLTATVAGTGTIDLRWVDNEDRERNWVVERSLQPASGFTRIGVTAKDVVTYRDGGLAIGLTLYYRVIAIGHGNRAISAYSNVVSATTRDMTPPSVPTGLAAAAVSCGQVNLSWTTAIDTGGSALKGYNLYRNGTFRKQVIATTTTETGLAASTAFSYAVSAVDNAGNESARSTTASAVTPACPATTTTTTSTTTSSTTSSTTTSSSTTTTTTVPTTTATPTATPKPKPKPTATATASGDNPY
jgi:hypothetical protein